MWDEQLIGFHRQLLLQAKAPRGIEVLHPYQDVYTMSLCTKFFRKYYHDNKPRRLMLGINPGRFGSGITGISFTDPVRLENDCGIPNNFTKRGELSSDFIYRMIAAYGGPADFYSRQLISAASPLGFVRAGKNINYYDESKLQQAVTPFISDSISRLMNMGCDRKKIPIAKSSILKKQNEKPSTAKIDEIESKPCRQHSSNLDKMNRTVVVTTIAEKATSVLLLK